MNAILFHDEVADDLNEATRWYEAQRSGLGREFRAAFDEALDRAAASPLRFPRVDSDMRCARLRKFPYGIYYELLRETVIVVYAVLHHSRDPKIREERLETS